MGGTEGSGLGVYFRGLAPEAKQRTLEAGLVETIRYWKEIETWDLHWLGWALKTPGSWS